MTSRPPDGPPPTERPPAGAPPGAPSRPDPAEAVMREGPGAPVAAPAEPPDLSDCAPSAALPPDEPAHPPPADGAAHPLDQDLPAASPAVAVAPPLATRLTEFDSAQLGAIAHLYRGEVYRSTVWRTRLDNTTNWSIVMMGVALTSTFSSPSASALPLLVVGMLLLVFLVFEARRYRYFNVWRARARWIEKHLYAPMLLGDHVDPGWRDVLAADYEEPVHHISMAQALGRRLRRNFIWILAIQSTAYWGKIAIHPFPAQDIHDLIGRAAIGPIPGVAVLIAGLLYNGMWVAVAVWSWRVDHAKWGPDGSRGMG